MRRSLRALISGSLCLAVLWPSGAGALEFPRTLTRGDTGDDVKALQVRVAGWYPNDRQRQLKLTGTFNRRTMKAVKQLQRHYGLVVDGVAGAKVFAVLEGLEGVDGSTEHFDWSEFDQNYNDRCSSAANKYAGTFKGGKVPREEVRANVQRLMWRLEALRAKGGDKPIGINSGFRSVAYNKCIGGAGLSQHMYGTAADMRVVGRSNDATRQGARRSQFFGIACYSGFTHNHLDLRLENDRLPEARYWWWPREDSKGRELAEDGKPCWGETSRDQSATARLLRAARAAAAVSGTAVPSADEVDAFERGGEPMLDGLAD